MNSKYKIVAAICARGGSKSVKNKNIRPLGGKPLIDHSLECAAQCDLIDEIVVSSDDDQILERAKGFSEVHIRKRPVELANDVIPRLEAVKDAVLWLEEKVNLTFDIVVDLGVATPLKTKDDLTQCVQTLLEKKATNVFSVTEAVKNPYYNMVELVEGRVQIVKNSHGVFQCRQECPKVFEMNDAFNVWFRDSLFKDRAQFQERTQLFEMPAERSIDIDTELDFRLAELIVQEKEAKGG